MAAEHSPPPYKLEGVTPSDGDEKTTATGPKGNNRDPQGEAEALRNYSKYLGWLVLAIIVAYAGLQLPLPWRIVTILAGLIGLVGSIMLFIRCVRHRLPAMIYISSIVTASCCVFFLLTASTQAVFWEASVTFDDCLDAAVTDRAENLCYTEYEEDIMSSIPGIP